MRIKMMPDYKRHPLWWDVPGRDEDIDPASLGLSASLVSELKDWSDYWDETQISDEHGNSGFPGQAALRAFEERGRALAERIGRELGPGVRVRGWR